jgi:carboxyl-terminal processing protease
MKLLSYLTILAGIIACAAITAQTQYPQQYNTPSAKLRMAEAAISQFYVDTVNENTLVENAIRGMLENLDPHSSYSTPEETRELNEPLQGNFSGVGITFNMNQDTLYVIQTVAGGPSEKVGILAGDRFIEINDTIVAGVKMKNSDIMKRLRGPKGTNVNVKVLRKERNSNDTIDFKITRAEIPIYSVDAAYMVDDKTGYIRVNKFAAETHTEVAKAMKSLKGKGMQQLILDLTDNGGGYLNAAVDLLGELLPNGTLAVYTEGQNSPRHDNYAFPSGKSPLFGDGRLVIMVNQYSASASEITSGAIQDWDRGVIVGRRTFGKGLVQRPMPFPDGSMMRLTVAHYYTPTGRDIQKPYTKGKQKEYQQDMLDRLNRGELMHKDSIKYIDSLRVNTLTLHRPIYGGGGISPDKFVPLDTTEYTKYYRNVMAKGLLNRYAIEYVDNHRNEIKKQYKTDSDYVKRFQITSEMLNTLKEMADKEGVEYNAEQAELSAPLFKMILKALIGRDIYENATYFKVYNQYDPIFNEALKLINSQDYTTILSQS